MTRFAPSLGIKKKLMLYLFINKFQFFLGYAKGIAAPAIGEIGLPDYAQ